MSSTPATPAANTTAAANSPSATPAPAATTGDTTSNTAALGAAGAAGQDTYGKACVVCHGAGVAGAPKLGDKGDWGPRIAQGNDLLYEHAIKGYTGKKGMMPPKGGNTALADADVKAAVDYMVAQGR
jgi:cytochrome c5